MWMVQSRSGWSSTTARSSVAVGDVALVEDPVAHERPRAGQQRVQDHRRVPGLLERLGRRGADVAGAAGDQDLHAADPRRAGGRTLSQWSAAARRPASRPGAGQRVGQRGGMGAAVRWAGISGCGTTTGRASARTSIARIGGGGGCRRAAPRRGAGCPPGGRAAAAAPARGPGTASRRQHQRHVHGASPPSRKA